MEALPIFLDALLPAWGAILISVTLSLGFSEIIPQVVCSRYGLSIGAKLSPLVRLLIIVVSPISYANCCAVLWHRVSVYTERLGDLAVKNVVPGGRGKGKKQSSIAAREDAGSGEDEKLPVRRRGRPHKSLKDDVEEDEDIEKMEEEEDSKSAKSSVLNKENKNQPAVENGRKKKRPSQVKENLDSVKEEYNMGNRTNTNDAMKSVGFRQNDSRRKNKPRRAAEVGVE